jgi:hypothetical protein
MKTSRYFSGAIAFIFLVSCTSPNLEQKPPSTSNPGTDTQSQPQEITLDKNFKIAMGQTIYVPIYSHIYFDNRQTVFNLAATLSIRNTDLNNPIVIKSVRYYDTNGQFLKQYLERPQQLGPLASTDFIVERTDTSGGSGANFIVEWIAQKTVTEPIVEAVAIGTESTQGISFISPGKVIKNHNNH